MGQNVMALVLGVQLKKGQEKKLHVLDEDGCSTGELRPGAPALKLEYGTEREVTGIAVAVQNVPEASRGEVELPTCLSLADTEKKLRAPLKEAQKKWAAFSKWAISRGVELPAPHLFIVQVERA